MLTLIARVGHSVSLGGALGKTTARSKFEELLGKLDRAFRPRPNLAGTNYAREQLLPGTLASSRLSRGKSHEVLSVTGIAPLEVYHLGSPVAIERTAAGQPF